MTDEKSKRSDLTCLLLVLGFFGLLGIGLLVALFSSAYGHNRKHACGARQAEAKSNLGGLYTAEKAFQGEYNVYSSDLISVNWAPHEGQPAYVYGFAAPSHDADERLKNEIPGYDSARNTSDHPGVIGSPARYSTARTTELSRSLLPADALVTGTSFLAAAVGNVDGDPGLDIWTIDQSRALTVLVNDCVQ